MLKKKIPFPTTENPEKKSLADLPSLYWEILHEANRNNKTYLLPTRP